MTSERNPSVAIILLNWNNSAETLQCLESLKQVTYGPMEIIVVDNGSKDDSLLELAKYREELPFTVLKNSENLGFSGGNNTGIAYALARDSAYILLLNNDTTVAADFLEELVREGEAHKDVGIIGPAIYFSKSPRLLWFNGGKLLWRRMTGCITHDDLWQEQHKTEPQETGFITGCALMARRNVFENIGTLDPRFFLYFEDADFNIRAKRVGWRMRVVPRAKIWHQVSVTTLGKLGSPTVLYYHNRNILLLARKHGPWWIRIYMHFWAFWKAWKQIVKILILPVSVDQKTKARFILRGVMDYYRGSFYIMK